jgi:hypothetical protein
MNKYQQFHFDNSKINYTSTPHKKVNLWKLIVIGEGGQNELVRGLYALCKHKLNSIKERRYGTVYKIVPAD